MKRFLIFTLLGPLIGIATMSVCLTWGIKAIYTVEMMLRVLVSVMYTFRFFVVSMAMLSWACDLLLIHWEVKLWIRIMTIGGGVTVLTVGLGRAGLDAVLVGAICGATAAFCVWLSARVEIERNYGDT